MKPVNTEKARERNGIAWRAFSGLIVLVTISLPVHGQRAPEGEPDVPFRYGLGMEKYQSMCAECHGKWAVGTDKGPPLIHKYYQPSHHPDRSFYRAILSGARAHHWKFGDMAPIPEATEQDAKSITEFVRWLQKYRKLY